MMTSSTCRHRTITLSVSVFFVLAAIAANLPARSTASEAISTGNHRRFALPLRTAMEVYASSKDNEDERSPMDDVTALDDDEDAETAIDDDRFSAAAVVRRGFRNGGRDRFSHGFGRKRSAEGVELEAIRPDLRGRVARDLADVSLSGASRLGRRQTRAAAQRRHNVLG